MKNHIVLSFFVLLFGLLCSQNIYAQDNNKFGMSLLQPTDEDIYSTAKLINSKGGDWGYVTLVIQENDRNTRKWQDLFEKLRENHLIPIIRLATSPQGEVWRRPEPKDTQDWVSFLNSLNWVVKKRYVVLFNEPNHASEWGGEVDPVGYVEMSYLLSRELKESNNDYVIMYAGLDAAAPHYPNQFYDSGEFIRKMCNYSDTPRFSEIKANKLEDLLNKSDELMSKKVNGDENQKKMPDLQQNAGCPLLFAHIDAWASHSYPNPGFRGSVWDTGKKSIRGYEYELQLLKELGVEKNLPVFITETGWQRKELSESIIEQNYKFAFESIWGLDDRIQAITPFVFSYVTEPFVGFSWKKEDGYYPHYFTVQSLQKIKGTPEQIEKGSISVQFPKELVANSSYRFPLHLENRGQSIWDETMGYNLKVEGENNDVFSVLLPDIKKIKPQEELDTFLLLKTKQKSPSSSFSLQLKKNNEVLFSVNAIPLVIKPLPHIELRTSFFPKTQQSANNLEFQLFSENEELVFAKKGIEIRTGTGIVDGVQNVIPGAMYRAVLLGYPYIPRQTKLRIKGSDDRVEFKTMFPFDANGNGAWELSDVFAVFRNPSYFLYFVPWY